MTEPLSPAAQKVRHVAICAGPELEGRIAAALLAAVDQVVPEECLARFPNNSEWQDGFTAANERIRTELLAIAAELGEQ